MEETKQLLDAHAEALYSFCLYLAGNRQDGEDLFQDTCVRAMELSRKIDRGRNPKSYLFSIAVHLWRNLSRKRARRGRIAPADASEEALAQAPDHHTDVAECVAQGEERAALLAHVRRLDDKHRIPLLLFYAEGMKVAEIAGVLGRPQGSVKRQLHEAKAQLRREMEGQGYGG